MNTYFIFPLTDALRLFILSQLKKKIRREKQRTARFEKKSGCRKNRVTQELSLNLIRLLVYSVLCKHEQSSDFQEADTLELAKAVENAFFSHMKECTPQSERGSACLLI